MYTDYFKFYELIINALIIGPITGTTEIKYVYGLESKLFPIEDLYIRSPKLPPINGIDRERRIQNITIARTPTLHTIDPIYSIERFKIYNSIIYEFAIY